MPRKNKKKKGRNVTIECVFCEDQWTKWVSYNYKGFRRDQTSALYSCEDCFDSGITNGSEEFVNMKLWAGNNFD